ncbi:MAG: HPF/RaiA family ribosome-associated protein [Vicinamibacterales bacterium]
MQQPPEVTFRGVRRSDGLTADIERRLAKLETFYQPIIGCRVQLSLAERRHNSGNRYRVRLDLGVPGGHIVVSHDASHRPEARRNGTGRLTRQLETEADHRFARVAIRETFDIARRQLQDFARRQRGAVKARTGRP